jgi:hypothetical protein
MTQPRETDENNVMDATDNSVDWTETVQVEQKSESGQKTLNGLST